MIAPLRCGICDRTIPGMTGLQELNNLQAHMEEHHEQSLDLMAAAELREQWEAVQANSQEEA